MNSHHEFDDSRQLDRLIDGELAGDEYRVFLATLDKQPDGWRRCAMAFLEAQAWQQELGRLREGVLFGHSEVVSQRVVRGNSSWSTMQVVGLLLAMAASFAAAFASGVWWVGNSSTSESVLPTVVRQNSESLPTGLDGKLTQEADFKPKPSGNPTEHLAFVVDRDNGQSDRFELPIYDANDRFARQLLQDSPSMPAEVERAIREQGFHVKRQRQWAPVRLRDGRRVLFPVDQLDITPVSGTIYH